MDKIAVLIPCYNESLTIEKVVSDYKEALARKAGAKVVYEYRQGKGNVIRSMFRDIDAECYLMIDGDDTYPAENAREMVDLVLNKGVDMVIGDRLSSTYFTENKRPFHNMGNRIVRGLINHLFHSNVKDIMTGYRAFSRLFVKSFPVLSKGFEIETEMTIHALDKNFLLEEIPVTYRDRPEGSESKLNTVSDGMKVLKTIASLFRDYKPLLFFSCASIICLLLGIGFFVPVFVSYIHTGLVEKIPTIIVSGVVFTVGILLWICGLILDVVVKKHRQLYEIELNQLEIGMKNNR